MSPLDGNLALLAPVYAEFAKGANQQRLAYLILLMDLWRAHKFAFHCYSGERIALDWPTIILTAFKVSNVAFFEGRADCCMFPSYVSGDARATNMVNGYAILIVRSNTFAPSNFSYQLQIARLAAYFVFGSATTTELVCSHLCGTTIAFVSLIWSLRRRWPTWIASFILMLSARVRIGRPAKLKTAVRSLRIETKKRF